MLEVERHLVRAPNITCGAKFDLLAEPTRQRHRSFA